jgi:hypothetical protein
MTAPYQPYQPRPGQLNFGWRQLRWSPRCRALVFPVLLAASWARSPRCGALAVPLLIAASWACLGCGEVHFVPSPFTPQNVELIYSTQEDISIVRWRISSTAPLGDLDFQILEDTGYQHVDFSRSVYPGGGSICADGVGSCFQYVRRGSYPVASRPNPIRAVHSVYGTLPGGRAIAQTVPQTIGVVSFFHTNNDLVYVNIADAVASADPYVFPRSYERTMWPTSGLCVSDSPDTVSFSPLDATGGFPPAPLTDSGIYCVAIRPIPADTGKSAIAQTRVETVPEVTTVDQTYVPTVEQSPVIYQIVLDLEIPLADRCATALTTIESLVDKYMSSVSVPVRKLPTMNLATNPNATGGAVNCAQTSGRTLPASDMAEAVKQVVATFPQTHQQFHFFYFNNLNSPLPTTLTDSLTALFDALASPPAPYDLATLSWLFNPGLAAATGPTWWMSQPPWEAADDPSFEPTLAAYVQQTLPYESQSHDPSSPVPLLSPADAAQDDGDLFKICYSSPGALAAYTAPPEQLFGGPSWPVVGSDPPGYLVNLPTQISVPATSFVEAIADIDFQICSRYCVDHPYLSTSGTGASSWASSPACAGAD